MVDAPTGTHRFALVISGAVALGAYEAGVLAQLYQDFHAINAIRDAPTHLAVDAIAGSSAGSLTGLMLAHALASEATPSQFEQRLRACWVDSLDILGLLHPKGDRAGALFTEATIQEIAGKVLVPPSGQPVSDMTRGLALWITMTNLDGVPYSIPFDRVRAPDNPVTFYPLSYRDYAPFVIRGPAIRHASIPVDRSDWSGWQGLAPASWDDARDAAIASGSFPLAFSSRPLERDLTRYQDYVEFRDELAITDPELADRLADRARFLYADGGILNNQPLGRAIDAVRYLERLDPDRQGDGRTFLVIEPEPNTPRSISKLVMDPMATQDALSLGATVAKLAQVYFYDALYSDIAQAARVNRQLAAFDEAADESNFRDPQRSMVKRALGLEDRRQIALERIPHTLHGDDRLAGDFAGHFGGFLDRNLRETDFATGKYEAREWILDWLNSQAKASGASAIAASLAPVAEPDRRLVNTGWDDLAERRGKILAKGMDRIEVLAGRWIAQMKPYLHAVRAVLMPKTRQLFGGGPPARLAWLSGLSALWDTPARSTLIGAAILVLAALAITFTLGWLARGWFAAVT